MMTVMENSPDIFSVLSRDATVTYINRSSFPGISEPFGKNMLNVREADQATKFYRHLISVFNTNTSVELQESFKDKHYLTKLVPIKIEDQVKEVLSINIDITNQKQSEIELKLAKEAAEESNRLKTIFLGSLSHEVRTPLQGIMGMAELLELSTTSEEKRKEFIQIIKRRTNDMQNIIESLLDMASLETGEIKSFPVLTNLYEWLQTAYQNTLHDHLLATKPIQLKIEIDIDKNAVVFVDPQHLQQVLTNLLRNSIKFTNEGSITITAKIEGENYCVQVKDTGIGIEPEKMDHIFKPFRQAHEGLSRSKGGIGLGLSICKKMVEMWNGQIFVESTPGNGSTFSITIPTKYK
jgi:signal transduction histidine kinase